MMFSDNGWPGIEKREDTKVINVPGTDLHLRVAPATAWIFSRFTGKFHAEIESLTGGQLDDWGYAWRNVRGSSTRLSCHASGTAVDLNALMHPRGVKGTYGKQKLGRLLALLQEFADPLTGRPVIRWGGFFTFPSIVDEMHFQIYGDEAALKRVQEKLEEEDSDVSFKDRHTLTEADVAAYGNDELTAGESEKSYDEIVRFPPAVARLRRELAERDAQLSKQIADLVKAVAALTKK